jgi:hypothetical protein
VTTTEVVVGPAYGNDEDKRSMGSQSGERRIHDLSEFSCIPVDNGGMLVCSVLDCTCKAML